MNTLTLTELQKLEAAASMKDKGYLPEDWPRGARIRHATVTFLESLDRSNLPETYVLQAQLFQATNEALVTGYRLVTKNGKERRVPQFNLGQISDLEPFQVAHLLNFLYTICVVTPGGADSDDGLGILAMYQVVGIFQGTHRRMDRGLLERLAHQFGQNAGEAWLKEVERTLRRIVPSVTEDTDQDIIFMNNCVLNYRTKERFPFSADRVRLAKYATSLPEVAPELPRIRNTDGSWWDPESWMEELMPDEETRHLLLEIIGAAFRPGVDWQQTASAT